MYLFIQIIFIYLLNLFTQVCYFIILKTLNLYDASTCMTISDKHCFCLLQGIAMNVVVEMTKYLTLLLRSCYIIIKGSLWEYIIYKAT